jgi:hypothetical protein
MIANCIADEEVVIARVRSSRPSVIYVKEGCSFLEEVWCRGGACKWVLDELTAIQILDCC